MITWHTRSTVQAGWRPGQRGNLERYCGWSAPEVLPRLDAGCQVAPVSSKWSRDHSGVASDSDTTTPAMVGPTKKSLRLIHQLGALRVSLSDQCWLCLTLDTCYITHMMNVMYCLISQWGCVCMQKFNEVQFICKRPSQWYLNMLLHTYCTYIQHYTQSFTIHHKTIPHETVLLVRNNPNEKSKGNKK